jgi:hypothetical protein
LSAQVASPGTDIEPAINVALGRFWVRGEFRNGAPVELGADMAAKVAAWLGMVEISQQTAREKSEDIAEALAELFEVLPAKHGDPVRRAEVYIRELEDLPAWALLHVIRGVIRGEIGGYSFVPLISQLRDHVKRAVEGSECWCEKARRALECERRLRLAASSERA